MRQEELELLLDDMSLHEKIYQLLQLPGTYYDGTVTTTGDNRDDSFSRDCVGQAGSVIGVCGAKEMKKIQDQIMESQPHHIPAVFMLDVVNGFRTIFPIPLAQGASFEPELSGRCARAAGKEAAVSGVQVTFAPMVDLVRDARWGRVMESTGEDPYLNSRFAEAMVTGFQGDDPGSPYSLAACVKHFAAYGAPTAGREYHAVDMSDRELHEYYLPAYQAAIDAGSELVMTAFNTLNGIPASGNTHLLREILRKEMGFEGVLIADYAALEDMIYHGFAENREAAARLALTAGVDIDMVTTIYSNELPRLVQEGKIEEKLIDEAVMRILQLKNRLGLFENPYKEADEREEQEVILCEEHRILAKEAAEKSFVLLKNEENLLPIADTGKKIALIGPYVNEKNIYGAWSFLGDSQDAVTIQEGVEKVYQQNLLTYAKGSPMLDESEEAKIMVEGFYHEKENRGNEQKLLEEALALAEEADVVVLALGEHFQQTGEGASRADITLPQPQMNLFREIKKTNKKVAVILFSGRPLDIRELAEEADAILEVWMPGTEGGTAIAETLAGIHNPSGKLSMSFPWCVGQVPVFYNQPSTGKPYHDGEKSGRFRSRYLDIPNGPLYPFGYGKSYTVFEYLDYYITSEILRKEGSITAGVTIKNTGEHEGTETVQLYIQDCFASVVRPVKELKGFQKIKLKPGEEQEVSFAITEPMLRFWKSEGIKDSEAGEFKVYIGTDSNCETALGFYLE